MTRIGLKVRWQQTRAVKRANEPWSRERLDDADDSHEGNANWSVEDHAQVWPTYRRSAASARGSAKRERRRSSPSTPCWAALSATGSLAICEHVWWSHRLQSRKSVLSRSEPTVVVILTD